MKDSHLKTLYIISVAFAIFLMVVPCGLAAAVIRGVPVDTNKTSSDGFTWNATTFGGFCYPVNKHQNFVNNNAWGEHLQIDSSAGFGVSNPSEHNIEEDELIYSTKQFNCKYEIVSDLDLTGSSIPSELGNGFYYRLPFFGKPYIAVENDATQLHPGAGRPPTPRPPRRRPRSRGTRAARAGTRAQRRGCGTRRGRRSPAGYQPIRRQWHCNQFGRD